MAPATTEVLPASATSEATPAARAAEDEDVVVRGLGVALDSQCMALDDALGAIGAVSHAWREAALLSLATAWQDVDLRRFADRADDEAVRRIVSATPLLRSLNLSNCVHVTDAALAHLRPRSSPLLTELNLACMPLITADAAEAVVDAYGPQLVALELSGCRRIGAAELVRRFGRFLELDEDEDGLSKVQG